MGFRAPLPKDWPTLLDEAARRRDTAREVQATQNGILAAQGGIGPGVGLPVYGDPCDIVVENFVLGPDARFAAWRESVGEVMGSAFDAIDWPWPTRAWNYVLDGPLLVTDPG